MALNYIVPLGTTIQSLYCRDYNNRFTSVELSDNQCLNTLGAATTKDLSPNNFSYPYMIQLLSVI